MDKALIAVVAQQLGACGWVLLDPDHLKRQWPFDAPGYINAQSAPGPYRDIVQRHSRHTMPFLLTQSNGRRVPGLTLSFRNLASRIGDLLDIDIENIQAANDDEVLALVLEKSRR